MYKLILFCFSCLLLSISAVDAKQTCNPKNALGVSRVIEIDTTGGPLYGRHQYKRTLPLKSKEIVLTFDDGPHPEHTISVLKTLREHCTKATFFAVGKMATTFPTTLQKVAEEGHTIGGHTHSHPRMPDIPLKRAKREIERGFAELLAAVGQPIAPFFRYPGLRHSKQMNAYVQSRNISVMSVDVISGDTKNKTTKGIISRTMRLLRQRRNRGIILLHDLQKTTAAALPHLFSELKRQGYKVVHIVPKKKFTKALYELPADAIKAPVQIAQKHDHNHDTPYDDSGVWTELKEALTDMFGG